MDSKNSKLILALALINKEGVFNNSFKLMRIMEWYFGATNSEEILDEVKEKKYAEYEIINGVHYYKLTESGRAVIKQGSKEALDVLLEEFPKEKEPLLNIFSAFEQ